MNTWKEVTEPNEAQKFEALAAQLAGLQSGLASKHGMKRALHAKANLSARARFEVKSDVPKDLRVGLFAEAKAYDSVVRFSNGSATAQRDSTGDVRGLAVKVIGVGGKKVIPGLENCVTQDFLSILNPAIPFRTPEEFVWVVVNARKPATFLPKAVFKLGPGRLLSIIGGLKKSMGAPRLALHSNRYFSALPIRFGPGAAKFSFAPRVSPIPSTSDDLGQELADNLRKGSLIWDFQVQMFVDEASTPIENPMVEWKSPFTAVATLTVPQQDVASAPGQALSQWVESLSFDPWHAQEELRPLGAMMRARNVAYRSSTMARGAAPEPTELPADLARS